MFLNQLPLYLLTVSPTLLTFNVFLIASLVNLSFLVTPNVDLEDLISAVWILFLTFSISTLDGLPTYRGEDVCAPRYDSKS
jgi:hypothetical protein